MESSMAKTCPVPSFNIAISKTKMLGGKKNGQKQNSSGRTLGSTETSWCKAISGGTGIVVLTFQVSKKIEISLLQNVLHQLQNVHPILRSKLHYNTTRKTFSFITLPIPNVQIKIFDLSSTSELIHSLSKKCNTSQLSPLHMIQEHEMNKNVWLNHPSSFPEEGMDMLFSSMYELPGSKWIVTLRFHTAACDRTTAESLLRELMELAGKRDVDGSENEVKNENKICLAIEDLSPSGKTKKTLWAHGLDMLEYSLNSFRLTNMRFKDVKWPRCSEVVRLKMNSQDTNQILAGCKPRGIKLCGVLAAAGLIAAHSCKFNPEADQQRKKYAVVTLIDCRTVLDPPLTAHDYGFYHSAIINVHVMKGAEKLWNLATRCYMAVENTKKCNKHFSDMADLNFLMCKAIENPSLTASSSLRTSLISVFEDPVFDHSNQIQQEFGLEDYIGCASVHGVGPSIAFFDTIRDGQLDCVCVYPSPLHSRDQMLELVDKMKRVLIDAVN